MEMIERCEAEIAEAVVNQRPGELGALMGECDWRVERSLVLKAPFPYFGGKSKVANLVWDRFGKVANYCEPFAGSLAVLLARPHAAGIETVSDVSHYLANYWRCVAVDPDAVAMYADWPVNEVDQHARHQWLVDNAEFRAKMESDPEYCDAKVAGWWLWGICQWIGSGWCDRGKGAGVQRKRPHLNVGMGVNRKSPHLKGGMGVNRKPPHLGDAGRGEYLPIAHDTDSFVAIREYMRQLSQRLRRVRVCCGDFERILGPTPTEKLGLTGVFLDPPYSLEANRNMGVYGDSDDGAVAHRARAWAIANGDNPMLRIALAGYEGEHAMPDSWECVAWKTRGGYGTQSADPASNGKLNAGRERIWFNRACLRAPSLFD